MSLSVCHTGSVCPQTTTTQPELLHWFSSTKRLHFIKFSVHVAWQKYFAIRNVPPVMFSHNGSCGDVTPSQQPYCNTVHGLTPLMYDIGCILSQMTVGSRTTRVLHVRVAQVEYVMEVQYLSPSTPLTCQRNRQLVANVFHLQHSTIDSHVLAPWSFDLPPKIEHDNCRPLLDGNISGKMNSVVSYAKMSLKSAATAIFKFHTVVQKYIEGEIEYLIMCMYKKFLRN